MRDYSLVTEQPSRRVGRETRDIICRRYALAARHAIGARVLEVGCGPGFGLGVLARRGRGVVGGEVTEATLRQAAATYGGRPGVQVIRMDAHVLPFRDGSFDTVLALAVIYYLDLDTFLRESARVLRLGGVLVFCTPNRGSPGFRPSRYSTAYYSLPQLHEIVSRQGFDVEFYGAFPVKPGRARVLQRTVALGGTALDVLPLPGRVREGIKGAISAALGYERAVLPAELGEEDLRQAEALPLVPLAPRQHAADYRVLYGVARTGRRGATHDG